MRASDAERDHAVEVLRIAAGDGRLTTAELDQRLEAALAARTTGELATLTADLPGVSNQQARELVRITKRHGDIRRTGHWVVPQRMEIRVEAGDVKLDLTEAVIIHGSLHVDVHLAVRGALILVIKPGIVVDADDVEISWGDIRVGEVTGPHEPVILRVKATGRAPSGVIARPPRRIRGGGFRGWRSGDLRGF